MQLKSRRCLLQNSDRQALGLPQTMIVGAIADLPMSTPGGSRQALRLAMSRQAAKLSHKAKRRERLQPGKPFRRIRLEREQPVCGANHDIVFLLH